MNENWVETPWKIALKGAVDDAIAFFMPKLAAERDYSQKPEAADPVHTAIGAKSGKDSTISDVCFKMLLKAKGKRKVGAFSRTLFLVEQQHDETKKKKSVPQRVFQSWYRASDEYQIPVTALVIYTGSAKPVNTFTSDWHGTSVNFKFNTYSIRDQADVEELKKDRRPFALPVLAAKRMLDARGDPLKRGEYSLELLDLIKKRGLDSEKEWLYGNFTRKILRIDEEDVKKSIREVWKMQFRPIDEVVHDIHLNAAKEEGMMEGREKGRKEGRKEGMMKGLEKGMMEAARSMFAEGLSPEIIKKCTGLSKEDILALG